MLVSSCAFGAWDEGAAAHEIGGLGVGDAAELSSEDGLPSAATSNSFPSVSLPQSHAELCGATCDKNRAASFLFRDCRCIPP